jgi:radical SAM-linked protein
MSVTAIYGPGGPIRRSIINTVSQSILIVIKFRINGNLRFLSHAETMKVFHRACFRAGIKVVHSQGFNPHAKLSLPLPRSVALETDADLLCFRIDEEELNAAEAKTKSEVLESLKSKLQQQLPAGCELLTIDSEHAKVSFEPRQIRYVIPVQNGTEKEINDRIGEVMANDTLELQRRKNARGAMKVVNVRPFLKAMKIQDSDIIAECEYSAAGSVRVDEILKLLDIKAEDTRGPIRRTDVQWYKKN